MAISGGAKPSVEMVIKENKLVIGAQAMRQGVVSDVDIAIQRLVQNEVVYVSTYTPVREGVVRTINMMLGGG